MVKKFRVLLMLALVPMAPQVGAADLKADLLANEKALWTAWGKRDVEPAKQLVVENAVEVVGGGVPLLGREAILKEVSGNVCELRSFEFQNFAMRKLRADVVTVSYTATQDMVCAGQKQPGKLAVTAVWVEESGKWLQASYHESVISQ